MEISISKNRAAKKANHHAWFETVSPSNRSSFCDVLTSATWSPVVWTSKRMKANFKSCSYLALDFDDGFTIKEAESWLAKHEYSGIIGTSKSHQIDKYTPTGKLKPACDRFRLVVPFSRTIYDLDEYEMNMEKIMEALPCDPSCKDGARFFYPCKKIVHQVQGGKYEVMSEVEVEQEKKKRKAHLELVVSNNIVRKELGVMPAWIHEIIKYGVDESDSRHQYAYRIGATLQSLGYAEQDIVTLVMHSNISAIGLPDVERAVQNGFQRGTRDGKCSGATNKKR